MLKCCISALLVLVLCAAAFPASALMYYGEPLEGSSWGQGFYDTGIGYFDFMRVDWVSGPQFESPNTFRNFSVSGWSEDWSHPSCAAASGPEATYVAFALWFQGTQANRYEFIFTAYHGDTALESTRAIWNGGWSFAASTWYPDCPRQDPLPPVPEPTSLALIGAGLALAGIFTRMRRRA